MTEFEKAAADAAGDYCDKLGIHEDGDCLAQPFMMGFFAGADWMKERCVKVCEYSTIDGAVTLEHEIRAITGEKKFT